MNYPEHYQELTGLMKQLGKEIPDTMGSFTGLHKNAVAAGALSTKEKELISRGIGIAVRCHGCIAFHVKGSLDAGAGREEIMETIGVSVLMGGGPSVMYGCEALQALDQFTKEGS